MGKIIICVVLAVLVLCTVFAIILYDRKKQRTTVDSANLDKMKEDWLFYNFHIKVYDFLWNGKKPEDLIMSLGIDLEEYIRSCRVIEKEPQLKKMVVNFFYSAIIIGAAILMLPVLNFLLPALITALFLSFFELKQTKSLAKNKISQIEDDVLPFMDIFQSLLECGMSEEMAINIISEKMDTLLSKEFKNARKKADLGLLGWDTALEEMADKYNIEILTSLISTITVAYRNGIPMAEMVKQNNKDVKEKKLLLAKERAGKATNTILIPVVVFQFVPMFAAIAIPIVVILVNSFS